MPSPPGAASCSCSTCSRTPAAPGLHVGHPLGFTGTDVYSRYQRMAGRNVLYTMGFDAFGLPAEQFAVQTGTHPATTTADNIANYRTQIRRLGLSHDRRRSIDTTDPAYYRWTQWIFLQIFQSWYDPEARRPDGGLGRARPVADLRAELDEGIRTLDDGRDLEGPVPGRAGRRHRRRPPGLRLRRAGQLVPGLGTVVANEEVTADGRSDRGNFPVFERNMRQWMMRITAYADRLLDDLHVLEWTDSLKTMQRNWIGRSHGARVDFDSPAGPITVFTTRPDTLFGASFMVLAPEHPLVADLTTSEHAADGRRVPSPDRDPQGRRPPGRGTPEDGRVHRLVRHQPGHRPGHPGVDRRLRADGLRHRGDHGRAVRRPARLRVRPHVRARHPTDPAAARRVVRRPAHRPDARHRLLARGVHRRRPVRQLRQRRRRPEPARRRRVGHHCDQRVARGRGVRRAHRHLQAARLAVQPPALLGRAVPDRLRRRRASARPARRAAAADAARDGQLLAAHVRPRRRVLRAGEPARPADPLGRRHLDLGDGPQPYRRDTNVMPNWAGSCWYELRYCDPTNEKAFVDPEVERYWMGPQTDVRAGSPRRRRPVRRRRRARRAAPAVRPLLAQGAVRPRSRVVLGAVRPPVQPGLRAGRRLHRRAGGLRRGRRRRRANRTARSRSRAARSPASGGRWARA